jgi:urease accessory protein
MSPASDIPDTLRALRARYSDRAIGPDGLFLLDAHDAFEFIQEGIRAGLQLSGVDGFWTQSGGYQPDQWFSNDIFYFKGTDAEFVEKTRQLLALGANAGIRFEVGLVGPDEVLARQKEEAVSMIRATEVLRAGSWNGIPADIVTLDAEGRLRRRVAMKGQSGLSFLLDLAQTTNLRDNDGLRLEDGRVVLVRAAPELLAELSAADQTSLARIAFQLGNRHFPAQFLDDRIRIRRDHVIEPLMLKLGARVEHIEAPFEPEGGAYGHHHGS